MTTRIPLSGWLCLLALLTLFSACGGTRSSVPDTPATGAIAVTISGLPAGLDASVEIGGPGGFVQIVPSTQTIPNLPPGTYTVSAASVLSGTAVFGPHAASQAIEVGAGATAAAAVNYTQVASLRLALQEVASGLAAPLFLTAPNGDARLFIVERAGRIRVVQNSVVLPAPFLDISARVSTDGERGLLSMAFDPLYASNGFFFIYFTDLNGDIAIERFQVSVGDANLANPASSLPILGIPHRDFSNHNGGLAAFGPDGFLYLGTGDGGSAGDPLGNGQNLDALLGKLLRIDVSNASAAQPYAIPPSNPFVAQAGRRGEIWAYGLRNPWRYAFDEPTGLLYIADVGQNRIEEVNVATAASAGVNYGWNITEGTLCFPGDPCNKQGLMLPVLEYAHDAGGGCSITGGRVYRGTAIPELQGRFLYSDFCSGWLRSFVHSNGMAIERVDWNIVNAGSVFSFGEDAQKELYLLTTTGQVFRILRQ